MTFRWIKGFECGMCGFKSRLSGKIVKHVQEFPNCAFTEQSFVYLNEQGLVKK